MAPPDFENQSTASLNEIGKKAEKALSITLSQIDRQRRESKMRRDENFLDNLSLIKTVMVWACVVFVIVFFILVFIAGMLPYNTGTKGWSALEAVFVSIAGNTKTILLIVLGFFFRGYLPSHNDKNE